MQTSCSWTPKQSAIKDNYKILQGREEIKERWTEYCSSLCTDGGNSEAVIDALQQIASPPNKDELHCILYEEMKQQLGG